MLTFLKIFLTMCNSSEFDELYSGEIVLVGCFFVMGVGTIFLFNLLIAQQGCAYGTIYGNMLGHCG